MPAKDRRAKLCKKVKEIPGRRRAASIPFGITFVKLNQVLRGRINYFRPGSMKMWLKYDFSLRMRYKARVVIMKQWKNWDDIYKSDETEKTLSCNMSDGSIFKMVNSPLGLYGKRGEVTNFLLSPKVLALPNKKEGRPGLIDPLEYSLRKT